ncbi:MAG TPA: outer membrane beta-barrel protein [Candidatus Obscuribacterales bacterium]
MNSAGIRQSPLHGCRRQTVVQKLRYLGLVLGLWLALGATAQGTEAVNPPEQPAAEPDRIADIPSLTDPELGILRLQEAEPIAEPVEAPIPEETEELRSNDEAIAPSPAVEDPELGTLRLRDTTPSRSMRPSLFLLMDVHYFRSDNILLEDRDPSDDGILRPSLGLYAQQPLSVNTSLIAAVEGGISRYGSLTDLNYHDLRLQAGVRHNLSNQVSITADWSNRQLFDSDSGDRFLNDHSPRVLVSWQHDLADDLVVSSTYQARWSIADPSDRSRVIQSLSASLSHALQPNLAVGLDYRFTHVDFTHRDRLDSYHQLVAELTYDLNRRTRVLLYGGYSLGNSTDHSVNFDGTVFGIGIDTYVPLF